MNNELDYFNKENFGEYKMKKHKSIITTLVILTIISTIIGVLSI